MITFKAFCENFGSVGSYMDRLKAAETDSDLDFTDRRGRPWLSDARFVEVYKETIIPICTGMWHFREWLVDTFRVLPNRVSISRSSTWVNGFDRFRINLNQRHFLKDKGFSFKILMQQVERKWAELVPQVELHDVKMFPGYDSTKPEQPQIVGGQLRPPAFKDATIGKLSVCFTLQPIAPANVDADIKKMLEWYRGIRANAWEEFTHVEKAKIKADREGHNTEKSSTK